MIRRQPNRAAAILAAAIGVTGVLGRELMRRNVSSTLELVVFGLMMLLAIAYLVSVFFIKPDQKRKNDQPQTQAEADPRHRAQQPPAAQQIGRQGADREGRGQLKALAQA